MTEAMLEVSDLWAGYGETVVVRGVDLQVAREQTVVVIGPNGHGKTTLLRTISGLIKPTRGTISFEGELIDGRSADDIARRGLVHIPQGDHIFPDFTIEENLLMGAFPKDSWRRRHRSLERVYDLFPQLRERSQQRGRTLSGGERRQLALGRGLMRDARLLLVDEPSLGLAPVIIDAVYSAILRIAAEYTSILLVEENFSHIQALASQVSLLELGSIVRTGPIAELRQDRRIAESYLGAVQ